MEFWHQRAIVPKILSTALFHGQARTESPNSSASSTHWFVKVVSTLCFCHSESLAILNSDYFRNNLDPFVAYSVTYFLTSRLDEPSLACSFFCYSRLNLNVVHSESTFNLLLRSLCRVNLLDFAKTVYDYMRADRILPDKSLLDFLVSSFANAGKFGIAEEILIARADMCNLRDETVSPFVYNKFLSLLISRNQLDKAVVFFRGHILKSRAFRPDNCTFNIVIRGLCVAGNIEKAFELFDVMRSFGCCPDLFTYNTLINGLCRVGSADRGQVLLREIQLQCEFSPDVVTYTSVISGYCKLGEMASALKIYEQMVSSGVCPDVVTLTSLIEGYSRIGEMNQCMKLWDEMSKRNVRPNAFTFSILINGLCKGNRLNEACSFLRQLNGRKDIIPQPFIYNPVIDLLCKAGKIDEANAIVAEMEEKGCIHDKMTFTILILGHCMKGRMHDAIKIYKKMFSRGCAPDNITVTSLVTCLRKAGMAHEANEIEKNASNACSSSERSAKARINLKIPMAAY